MDTDNFLRVLNILEGNDLPPDVLKIVENALFEEFGATVIDDRLDNEVVELESKVRIGVFQIGAVWVWLTINTWNDLSVGKGPKGLQEEFDAYVGRRA